MSDIRSTMLIYIWKGIHKTEGLKHGMSYASNKQQLYDFLQQYHITVIHIISLPSAIYKKNQLNSLQRANWCDSLYQLISHSIPINEALLYLSKKNYGSIECSLYFYIYNKITLGISLSSAMKDLKKYFGQNFIDIITGSEKTNKTIYALQQCCNHAQSMHEVITKIKKTLFYPCLVLLMTIIITLILLCIVLPQFSSLLSSWSETLPAYTQFLLTLSQGIIKHSSLLIICSIIFSLVLLIYSNHLINAFLHITRNIPGIKKIHTYYMCYTTLLIWNTAISSGLDLSQTIQLTPSYICINKKVRILNATHAHFEQPEKKCNFIYNIKSSILYDIALGLPFSVALQNTALFMPIIVQMIELGEQTGQLATMLEQALIFQLKNWHKLIEKLTKWLEPITMMILALVIGSVIIALYMPICHINSGFSG